MDSAARPATMGPAMEGAGMYRRIVIGWDGGAEAHDALALAGLLRAPDAAGVAACVVSDAEPPAATHWRDALISTKVAWVDPRAIRGRSAAKGLHQCAEGMNADLIVVGSSRSEDVGRLVPGSVADGLVYEAPCALAVAPKGFRDVATDLRVVAVAYDGSKESARGLEEAAGIAGSAGASLRLVGIVSPLEVGRTDLLYHPRRSPEQAFERRRADLLRFLREAAESVPDELRPEVVVAEGQPGDMIVREAWNGTNLLVIASRVSASARGVVAGGTAIEVMRRAPCPVVVVPGGPEAPNGAGRSRFTAPA